MPKPLTTPDGTPVSRFCFGAMQMGGKADETASREMFDAAREAGINCFDTAFSYTDGRSEELIGAFAASGREGLFIATKCAHSGGASADNIRRQFDESRRRLRMDSVDLLYLHRWDDDTALEESFGALAALVEAGQVRHVGVSNYAAWQVMKAASVGARLGAPVAVLQPMYSLVKRQAEVEILPMALAEGFAVMSYSPLGGGLLTGKYADGAAEGRLVTDTMYKRRYGQGWMHEAARRLAAIAAERGADPATLAVAWAARHPGVTAPIISARSAEQLRPSLAALGFEMDDALYAELSALSPKPPPATDRLEEG